MTNAQVFEAFAYGGEAKGGSVRSEQQGDALVLMSYSTPIAFRDSDANYFFTERKFSVTTSKQQSQARSAVNTFMTLDDNRFRDEARKHGVYFGGAR